MSNEWTFTAPVYVGDTIAAEAVVVEVHPRKPVTKLDVRVTRQDGEVVLHGHAWCYTFRPEAATPPGEPSRDGAAAGDA